MEISKNNSNAILKEYQIRNDILCYEMDGFVFLMNMQDEIYSKIRGADTEKLKVSLMLI